MASPLKLRPARKGKCEGQLCKNRGKSVQRWSVLGRKLCFDCLPKKKQ